MTKGPVLNKEYERDGNYGKLILPIGNNTPSRFAMTTTYTPHSQVITQDFMLKNPRDYEPEVTAIEWIN